MDDKEYLLKLYKFKNSILDNLLNIEHHHKKIEWEKSRSYAAGIYNAYKHILYEVNNLINEVESDGCKTPCKDLDNKIDYIKSSDTPIYHAEYIQHLDMWRLYDPQYVYQSVAYFDSKDEIPETVIFDD